MEEELKTEPCPYCGNTQIDYYNVPYASFFSCSSCGLCGPRELYKDNAADAWNVLPRCLKWTKEKPKEPGWYWYKLRKNGPPSIIELRKYYNALRVISRWGYDDYVEDMRGYFSGPIPEPEELL